MSRTNDEKRLFKPLLAAYVGEPQSIQIMKWMEESGQSYPQMPNRAEEHLEIIERIRSNWCRANHREYVYKYENHKAVVNHIAKRLDYECANSMAQGDKELADAVHKAVGLFLWKDERVIYRNHSPETIAFIGNTIFKKVINAILTDEQKARWKDRERGQDKTQVRTVEVEVLKQEIESYMRKHWQEEFVYNEVASALNADWRQVSRLLDVLARSSDSGIVFYKLHRQRGGKRDGKTVGLYKYSEPRKKIDLRPGDTKRVVAGTIRKFLKAFPDSSERKIIEALQLVYGHLDKEIVRRVLNRLILADEVTTEPGPRRANLHRLSSEPLVSR